MQRVSDPQYDCVGRMSSVALLHKARAARVTVAVASLSVITLAPTPEVGAAANGVGVEDGVPVGADGAQVGA